jgi:zinc transport system ATP-binding protein
MAEPIIQLSHVGKSYQGRQVLDHVDATINAGEIVTLIGLNGSGKTTLLRIILGLELPDEGEVTIKPGLSMGYMPQRMHVEQTMPITVEGFLELYANDHAFMQEIIEQVGISSLLTSALQPLSGGEFQHVLLARALLNKPDVLMLDEPVQGVDITGQAVMYELVTEIARTHNMAVLMVSHDIHMVMAATEKVFCLNRHICCSGTPMAVSKDPEFVKLFGKKVADSLALYTHHHDHSHDLHGDVVN